MQKGSTDFAEAFALEIQDEFQAAADLYLKLLESDPEAGNAGFGVSGLIRCYKGTERYAEIIALLNDLMTSLVGTAAADNAKDHILPYLVQKGDWDTALEYAEELLQKNRGSAIHEPNYLFQVASIYMRKSGGNAGTDLSNALAAYGDLILKYPQSELASLAALDLEQLGLSGLTKHATAYQNSASSFRAFILYPNPPNPFNPETQIKFHLEREQRVALRIFDVSGRLVRRLAEGVYSPGEPVVNWNGRNEEGDTVASGIYFYELLAGEQSLKRRMALIH